MQKPTEVQNMLADLFSDLNQATMLWQFAILAASLAFAWIVARAVRQRVPEAEGALKFGIGGLSRAVFPLTALLLVLLSRAVLKQWYHVHVLNIAVPLLGSLALIRLAVYVLRSLFAPSGWLHTSERLIAAVVWIGLALHITGLLPEILDVLDSFGFRMGKIRISLLLILQGLVAIAATLLIAMWLGRILESRLMRTEQMDMNLRVILSKLVRALLIFVGILIALPVAGIDLTVLSVFGGALGVGLGFGLQKIASNYVSGFIILADRSIRLGDVVTIDNRHGVISRLGTRYTVVRAMDGTEALIPNETLVTSTVVNHSFSNREVLARLTLQISYQSPLEAAMTIMADAARAQPRVLRKPEPQAILKSFADNGIELELNFWIADPEEGAGSLKSAIQLEIWREFQRAGIEIPYPQRDIRIISGKPGQASGAGLAQ